MSEELAAKVLEMVGDRAEAEVLASEGISSLTRFANSFIHQNVAEHIESVNLRVAVDGRVASARTTVGDDKALARFVDDALETASRQPVDNDWPGLTAPSPVPDVEHYDAPTADASPVARAELVKEFVDQGKGLLAAGYCETEGQRHTFMNSAGQQASRRETSAILDGIHRTSTSAGSGHAASSAIGDIDAAAVGALAAKRARDSEKTFDAKPDAYEVVLAPEAVASIAVFLAFYGFNAKSLAEGQSFVDLGAVQFDPAFRFWDDATDPRTKGIVFDSEGTPKGKLDLVKDGISTAVAHDRRTAKKAGIPSTGHGFPGSETFGPAPFNLFVGAGSAAEEELIAGVERGIYVSTFNYCRVLDPKPLIVTGLTRNGTFMIENGRITGGVSNLRFTQSFVEALASGSVTGVGSNDRFADSEFGAGFVYAPSMSLASFHFTGGAEG
jgi:predicted Zn-dependent protease